AHLGGAGPVLCQISRSPRENGALRGEHRIARSERMSTAMDLGGRRPEVGRSVFVIPAEAFKSKRAHVVILNDVAWSIVQEQRGLHPLWVFPVDISGSYQSTTCG